MKKKYLYSLLSLLVAVCGFSAWSAAGGVNLLADGDTTELTPVLDKCIPAENGSVKGLSYILFTFGENETDIQLNPAYTSTTLGVISTPNANGTFSPVERITKTDTDRFDHQINGKQVAANQIVYHLANPISVEEAASYHITIANIFVSASGAVSTPVKYDFTIEPESHEPEPLTINTQACSPAEGSIVYEIPYVILTFGENDTDIQLNPAHTGTNVGFIAQAQSGSTVVNFRTANAADFLTHEINGEPLADNQIGIKLDKTITTTFKNTYRLYVNKGAFISGTTGAILDSSVQYQFTITLPPLEERPILSTEPANNSTVMAPVDMIIFTVDTDMEGLDKNRNYAGDPGTIVNVATGKVVETTDSGSFDYEVNGTELEMNQLAYFFNTPITEEGTYKVSIPSGLMKNKTYQNAPYEFTFTVEGTAAPKPLELNPQACFPAEGNVVNEELSYIILTFGTKDTNIALNPEFTGLNMGYIINKTASNTLVNFKTSDAETILTHVINGKALASNQIGIKLKTPIKVKSKTECVLYVSKGSFINETTGGVVEASKGYAFTLTQAPATLVPLASTTPASGSKVDTPVSAIFFTVDPKIGIVYVNEGFEGTPGSIVNANTNEVIETFVKDFISYEYDNAPLPDDQVVYVPKTPLQAGKYKVSLAADVLCDEDHNYANQAYEFTFTVTDGTEPDVETFEYGFSYASWGIYDNYDYTYRRINNDFTTNVTFTGLPKGVTLDSSKTPAKWIRESDGTVVEVNIMNFMGTDMMMFTESANWPKDPFGVWTCTLPQGLFTSGDQESVEKTIRLTWVDPNAENPKPTEFVVTKINFFDTPNSFENLEGQPVGAPADMMYTLWKTVEGGEDMMDWETNPKKIAALNLNKGFVINTNWDPWIKCFIAEVRRKDKTGEVDVWNQETVQEIYGYGNVCKNYVGSSASDCVAYQHPLLGCGGNENTREYPNGVEYTFDIWFYESLQARSMDNSKHDLAIGSYHFEFTGATLPFEYSQIAKLVSIDPTPLNAAELGLVTKAAGEITSVTQPIKFTWSAPVTMTARYSLGTEGDAAVESCTSNEEGTEWTVVTGAGPISNGEGGYLDQFSINIQAIDADGHYVKGNVGEKTNTMFVPEFEFTGIESGVNEFDATGLKVSDLNGAINVSGLYEGMNVSIYAFDGIKIAETVADGESVVFPNVVPGAYLIIVTSDSAKATVKYIHK